MFFLQQRNYQQISDKLFLTHFGRILKNFFFDSVNEPLVLIKKSTFKNVVRRISLRSLPDKLLCVKAGITVEASLLLPIFMFFVLNLFSVMEMLRFYGNVSWALNVVGGKVSLYGYLYEQSEPEIDMGLLGDVAFTYLYFKEEMLDVLGDEYIDSAPIVNGGEGLLFSKTEIMDNQMIEVVVTYEMKMPFMPGDLGKVRVYHSYQGRAWTGYEVVQEGKRVYVAETGGVYHISPECTYLDLSLRRVEFAELSEMRNLSGSRYNPCELCGAEKASAVWITDSGDKYHVEKTCLGIKRTVRQMSLTEAKEQGMEICSRCGEGEE